MVGPNTYNGGGVAPGPPAGGVRNNRGIQAQGRSSSIQEAIRKQKERKARQGVTNTQNQPLTQQKENGTARTTAVQSQAVGEEPGKAPTAPQPKGDPALPPLPTQGSTFKAVVNPYTEKPDPRDENYQANKNAIIASYGAQLAALDTQQSLDDNEYALTGKRLTEYNRRRVRDLGESRLGTGGAYTGGAREEQFQNANDFADDMGGRARDWMNRRAQRDIDRLRLRQQQDSDIRDLETTAADEMLKQLLGESQNSSGDEVEEVIPDSDSTGAAGGGPGKETADQAQKRLSAKVRIQNKRIEQLRKNLQTAKSPQQQQRIRNQLNRVRKRRTRAKGKLGKIGNQDQ